MRCPKCGQINYGDVQTCFNCSGDLFQGPQVSTPSRQYYQQPQSPMQPTQYYQQPQTQDQPTHTPPVKKKKASGKVILFLTFGIILILLGIIFLVLMGISIENSTRSDSTTISPGEPIDLGKSCEKGDVITIEFKADSPVNVIIVQKSDLMNPRLVSENKTKDKVEFEVPESGEWGVLIGCSEETKIDYTIYYESQTTINNCLIPGIIFIIIGIILIISGTVIRRKEKKKLIVPPPA